MKNNVLGATKLLTSEFPPVPRDAEQVEALLEALRSVLPSERTAWYVSTPITSGLHAPATGPQELIDAPDSSSLVESLRQKSARYVIDPTAVRDVAGWAQSDYRYFW